MASSSLRPFNFLSSSGKPRVFKSKAFQLLLAERKTMRLQVEGPSTSSRRAEKLCFSERCDHNFGGYAAKCNVQNIKNHSRLLFHLGNTSPTADIPNRKAETGCLQRI